MTVRMVQIFFKRLQNFLQSNRKYYLKEERDIFALSGHQISSGSIELFLKYRNFYFFEILIHHFFLIKNNNGYK